jgi:gentisate 1,2-dioxygenase
MKLHIEIDAALLGDTVEEQTAEIYSLFCADDDGRGAVSFVLEGTDDVIYLSSKDGLDCGFIRRATNALIKERDELRAELEELKRDDQDLTAAYMAGVEAGKEAYPTRPWEKYQEEKHKDGKQRLMEFRGGHKAVCRWLGDEWTYGWTYGWVTPIRVAELREPKT